MQINEDIMNIVLIINQRLSRIESFLMNEDENLFSMANEDKWFKEQEQIELGTARQDHTQPHSWADLYKLSESAVVKKHVGGLDE